MNMEEIMEIKCKRLIGFALAKDRTMLTFKLSAFSMKRPVSLNLTWPYEALWTNRSAKSLPSVPLHDDKYEIHADMRSNGSNVFLGKKT